MFPPTRGLSVDSIHVQDGREGDENGHEDDVEDPARWRRASKGERDHQHEAKGAGGSDVGLGGATHAAEIRRSPCGEWPSAAHLLTAVRHVAGTPSAPPVGRLILSPRWPCV